jgi:hypothetical protein
MTDLTPAFDLGPANKQKPRVAVLVDGDNIPHSERVCIEAKAKSLGDAIIRRVYGDMCLHKDWAAETEYLTVHCTTTAGKNRADIQLVIAALDIAYRRLATHFLILSDDKDFGPLVAHLREIGMQVEWSGKPKPAPKKPTSVQMMPKIVPVSDVDIRLHNFLRKATSGLTLLSLGASMKNGTVLAQTGKSTWRGYLSANPQF